MPLMTFQQAIAASGEEEKNVLLGNGFSMAYDYEMFNYKSLYEKAGIADGNATLASVFEEFGTWDFEEIMEGLQVASRVGAMYDCSEDSTQNMNTASSALKELLITAIANSHPRSCTDIPDNKYSTTREFLAYFKSYYTTNYDLLLYWTLLHQGDGGNISIMDGFHRPDDSLVWDNTNTTQASFYLHGAMHLYKEGFNVVKIEWADIEKPLTEQVQEKINDNIFPLVVSEPTSDKKMERIDSSMYLTHCLEEFSKIEGILFIHGHSFSSNDKHIWDTMTENSGISKIFVSLRGNENKPENIMKKARVTAVCAPKRLEHYFYSAESANIWANNRG